MLKNRPILKGIEPFIHMIGKISFSSFRLILNKNKIDINQRKIKFPDQRKVVTTTLLKN